MQLTLALALVALAPADAPPIQRPQALAKSLGLAPVAEAAPAPAPSESPTPVVEAPVEPPAPVVEAPVEPPAPVVEAPLDEAPQIPTSGADDPDLAPGLAPVRPYQGWVDDPRAARPRIRGTGMFAAAGALFGTALAFQLGDTILCGGCAMGFLERGFMAPALGLVAGGAALRGRSDAWHDIARRRSPRNTRGLLGAGVVMTLVGAGAGLANEAMWWKCAMGGGGPYAPETEAWGMTGCRTGVARAVLDASALTFGAGLGMTIYALRYRKMTARFRESGVVVAPQMSSQGASISVSGRF